MPEPRHASCYHVGYALTCAEYDDLLRLAQERCQLCAATTEKLYIDHDHAVGTWAVRGLICHSCNQHLKDVESGRCPRSAVVARYLANSWHIHQPTSAAKAARVKPKQDCPACGRQTAVYSNGKLHRHWSRRPGRHNTICPGITNPEHVGRPGTDLLERPEPPTS